MPIEDKLLAKYRSAAIGEAGEEIFFESNAALLIPADCENDNVAIIGIETFTIILGCIYPHLDGIFDYSPKGQQRWDEFRQQCNHDALKFMQQMCAEKGRNTWFTFVIFESNDYARRRHNLP